MKNFFEFIIIIIIGNVCAYAIADTKIEYWLLLCVYILCTISCDLIEIKNN